MGCARCECVNEKRSGGLAAAAHFTMHMYICMYACIETTHRLSHKPQGRRIAAVSRRGAGVLGMSRCTLCLYALACKSLGRLPPATHCRWLWLGSGSGAARAV